MGNKVIQMWGYKFDAFDLTIFVLVALAMILLVTIGVLFCCCCQKHQDELEQIALNDAKKLEKTAKNAGLVKALGRANSSPAMEAAEAPAEMMME